MSSQNPAPDFFLGLMAIEDFLMKPPCGICVEHLSGKSSVTTHSDRICIFIDDFETVAGRKVIFKNAFGRTVRVTSMAGCANMRTKFTSDLLLMLVSACEKSAGQRGRKADQQAKELQQFILMINGQNPRITRQMESGLNYVLSSVAVESYTVKIDVADALLKWTQEEGFTLPVDSHAITPDWQNTTFKFNYHSDALFDFPYWFGCSKRTFPINGKIILLKNETSEEKCVVDELFRPFLTLSS
ncbi:hypothetical protein FKM82_009640 [Ascaphus truei]